ncbi:endonuclease Q family protein [Candidatus Micrarchaeota archaeon]|nr:endonuclease Q family protein [Candidatus Micrarchaeota archaeon]
MILGDLHFHSKYSRATSPRNEIEILSKWAKYKGIHLLGTTDFTHPKWFSELKQKLNPWEKDNKGAIYDYNGIKYVLTSELSTIYKQDNKTRKVHNVIIAPDLEVVEQINDALGKRFNISYDGRPILGLPSPELVEIVTYFSKNVEVIPAHIWTPWFGVFGSKSGFDSLEEAYQEQVHKIHALETGLSSDLEMNWRLSALDKYTFISCSDAHSPENLGRELTVFEGELEKFGYEKMLSGIINKKVGTVEFYPQEGKYHWDGHRNCNVSLSPSESKKMKNICPVCKKPLTLGVEHRVEELADRPEGFVPKDAQKTEHLIPLKEIIAKVLNSPATSKKVAEEYMRIVRNYETEWGALHTKDISKMPPLIGAAVLKVRKGDVSVKPGYDGVYGVVKVDVENVLKEEKIKHPQKTLTEF